MCFQSQSHPRLTHCIELSWLISFHWNWSASLYLWEPCFWRILAHCFGECSVLNPAVTQGARWVPWYQFAPLFLGWVTSTRIEITLSFIIRNSFVGYVLKLYVYQVAHETFTCKFCLIWKIIYFLNNYCFFIVNRTCMAIPCILAVHIICIAPAQAASLSVSGLFHPFIWLLLLWKDPVWFPNRKILCC